MDAPCGIVLPKTIPPKPSPAKRFAVHKRGARGGGGPSERQNFPRIRIAMGWGARCRATQKGAWWCCCVANTTEHKETQRNPITTKAIRKMLRAVCCVCVFVGSMPIQNRRKKQIRAAARRASAVRRRRGPPRRTVSRLSCGGDQPPTRFTRAVRGARAAPVAPARAAPSLRTERRPKRRRETRTTTVQEEDEERTTAARDVRAEVRRLEPPTRAPRGAGARARAPIAVAAAPHRGSRKSSRKSLRRASGAPAEGRTTSTNN